MERYIEVKVSGSLGNKRVYLNDIEVKVNASKFEYYGPFEIGSELLVSYSGIGAEQSDIVIELVNARPSVITDVVAKHSSILIEQQLLEVV